MNRSRFFTLALALATASVAPAVVAQRAHTATAAHGHASSANGGGLRFHYATGPAVRYEFHKTETAPEPMGQTVTNGVLELETTAVDPDGTAHHRLRVVSMSLTNASLPAPRAQQLAQAAQSVANATVEFTQDARGRVASIGTPTIGVPQLAPLVIAAVQVFDQMSVQLAEHAVAPGGTWVEHRTSHVEMQGSLDIAQDFTYTLHTLENGVATIALRASTAIAPGAVVGRQHVTGSGTATGEVTVDTSHGRITHSASTGDLRIHVRNDQQEADVPTSFSYELTLQP